MSILIAANYWGDPHLITVDGFRYTFNGLGEYLLADVDSGLFQVQARTKRAANNARGTVFSAFVVKHQESVPVQIQLDGHNSTIVYVNGSAVTLNGGLLSIDSDFILDSTSNNSNVKLVHTAGLSFSFIPSQDMLSMIVALLPQYEGKTKALLGNYNGDPSDDIILPNGTVLSSNVSEETIFYNFGELCKATVCLFVLISSMTFL